MKKKFTETIDGSLKDTIQLKTVDNSLEYSQMFDALQDTPRDFQTKLIGALNSLSQTMKVPAEDVFNQVLCASNDENQDVKKKLYNWWRAFFEVLGKVSDGKMPKVRLSEYNQKIDDLMAEIMKAGDAESTEDEVVVESTKPRFKKGDFVVVRNGDDARVLGYYRDRVDKTIWYQVWVMDGNRTTEYPDEDVYASREEYEAKYLYEEDCKESVVSEGRNPNDSIRFGRGDIVDWDDPDTGERHMGWRVGSVSLDEFELFPPEGGKSVWVNEYYMDKARKFNEDYEEADKADEDEMNKDFDFAVQHIGEIANRVKDIVNFINPYCEKTLSEVDNTMKNTVDERGDSEWVSMDDIVGKEFGESDDVDHMAKEANDALSPEEFCDKMLEDAEDIDVDFSAYDSNVIDDETVALNVTVYRDEISDEEVEVEFKDMPTKYGWEYDSYAYSNEYNVEEGTKDILVYFRPMKQKMDEASVVVDANDVWDVLDLLSDEQANKNLTDLINSHVRTEEEIMDAIDTACGVETVTKDELNKIMTKNFVWIIDDLGLDVEQFKKDGQFVDPEKPVALEGSIKMTPEQRIAVDNAKKTAKKDGYDQYILFDKSDNSWAFERKHIQTKEDFAKFGQEVVGIVTSDDLQYKPYSLTESDDQKPDEIKDDEKKYKKDGETKTLVTGSDKENKKEMTDADAATIMGGASEIDMDASDMGLISHKVADPYKNKQEVTEMTIEQEIDNPWNLLELLWGQGRENFRDLLESELIDDDTLMMMLEDMEIKNLTSINDAFAYDFPTILDMLGLDGEAWSQHLKIKRKDDDSED